MSGQPAERKSNGGLAARLLLMALGSFAFGYALTMLPLLRSGMKLRPAVRVALAADTASIAIMEIVDNSLMLAIPGAMSAGLASPLFWGSLAVSLVVAGAAAGIPLTVMLLFRVFPVLSVFEITEIERQQTEKRRREVEAATSANAASTRGHAA